jgi:hypothetical protein
MKLLIHLHIVPWLECVQRYLYTPRVFMARCLSYALSSTTLKMKYARVLCIEWSNEERINFSGGIYTLLPSPTEWHGAHTVIKQNWSMHHATQNQYF